MVKIAAFYCGNLWYSLLDANQKLAQVNLLFKNTIRTQNLCEMDKDQEELSSIQKQQNLNVVEEC